MRETGINTHFPHCSRQELYYMLVRRGYNTFIVDLYNPMSHSNSTSLSYATAHETTNLAKKRH